MENLSHSRPPNRPSTSLSKKICNGNNASGGAFVAQTIYDDVYGGPPKFGVSNLSPRFEDYGEIFGTFHALRASSIPILDLPAVDETEVFFDARSSAFDYGEVFGAFDDLEFAVSYEDLINPFKGVDDGSSEEAWTPAGTESLSDCSDHSGKSRCLSNGDSNQSSGGSTEFCVSYHEVNRESNGNVSNGNGSTFVSQLQVLPGFTYRVDEENPSMEGMNDDLLLQATDDSYLNIDFNTGKVKGKHTRNTKPSTIESNGHGRSFENGLISQNGHGREVCGSNEDFITVSEISLRTEPSHVPPPSRPPPMFAIKKGDYTIRKLSTDREAASEVMLEDRSLPLFDVEVDASSSAAASAAAMKEAMDKAQAQLQSAKDMWERKKDGVHGRVKFDPKNDMKEKEGKLNKIQNQLNHLTNEEVYGIDEIHDHEIKVPTREKRQKFVKATEVFTAPRGGEELLTVAEKTLEDRHGSRFPVTEKYDRDSKWKEASEFFELARADIPGKEFEPVKNDKIANFVRGQMEAETDAEAWWKHGENSDKEVKPFQKAHVLQEKVKNIGTMVHGKEEDNIKLKPNKHETRQREQVKLKLPLGVGELEAHDKKFGVAQEFMDTKKNGASKSENYEKHVEFKQRENGLEEAEQPISLKDFKQKKNKVVKRKEDEGFLKESYKKENNGNKMEEAIENEEKEKLLREAFGKGILEQRMRTVLEQQENKKRLNMVLDEEENLKGQKASEKLLKGVSEEEDYGQREKEFDKIGVSERFRLSREQEDNNKWSKEKKIQTREDCETSVKDSFQPVDIEGMPGDAGESGETEAKVEDSHKSAELKGISMGHEERLQDRQKVNSTVGTQSYMEVDDFGIFAGTCQMYDNKNHLATNLARDHFETMGMSQEFLDLDEIGERITRVAVCESSSESGDVESLQFDENSCASSMCQPEIEHHEFPVKIEDTNIPLDEWTKKAGKGIRFEPKPGGLQAEATDEEDVLLFESSPNMADGEGEKELEKNPLKMENVKKPLSPDLSDAKAGQADIGMEQVHDGRMKFVTRMDSDPQHQEKLFCGMEDKRKSFNQVEEKEQEVSAPRVEVRAEKGREAETTHCTISERTQKYCESAHEVIADRATERKEKSVNQSRASKGKESERVRIEQEFENDILRKMEEEREREREREKDRMPIDRIALEPRDRVAAEARERAERAALERLTAEARQRALAEARERLEKACAEARENSQAGKATVEARVRAERAAVERAAAEARERAADKAMADRTSFGVRERIERSVSDKFSTSSRNNEMGLKASCTPYLQSQSFGPSVASRFTYYSACDERNEGVDGESPQRCKARLERHRRTEQRAAKALAEKNMRDLLAQREQAERNRLAETLDADVRRWSSGKEGNLRALLSTLQYILGQDSGWQPIPLTEVITAAAVKKAYRKATLCVHPDKLQQRGASIQQKYICEKVFDLLKEAWNKFNSEER